MDNPKKLSSISSLSGLVGTILLISGLFLSINRPYVGIPLVVIGLFLLLFGIIMSPRKDNPKEIDQEMFKLKGESGF